MTIGVDVAIRTVQHHFLRLKLSMLTYFVRLDKIVNFVGPQPNVSVCAERPTEINRIELLCIFIRNHGFPYVSFLLLLLACLVVCLFVCLCVVLFDNFW